MAPGPTGPLMPSMPRFAAALSVDPNAAAAEEQVTSRIVDALSGRRADLCVVFVSHHYGSAIEELGPRLAKATGARVVIGCTGESIIGGEREVEREPALSVWCAELPGVELRPFRVTARADGDQIHFSAVPDIGDSSRASVLLFGDPYSFPMDEYLKRLNANFPGVPAVGGMASGGMGPGQNLLISKDGIEAQGAHGVVLEGAIELRSVVSQGCRPIGRPWVVTACEEHLIGKLGGRPALDVLMETMTALAPEEQKLFQRGPFVGLAIDSAKSQFTRGDFLVRNVLGLSRDERAIAVSDILRRGHTVQFLVRDATSATEDLTQLMASAATGEVADPGSCGALLFTCNGRGSRMFQGADHDLRCVRTGLEANVPVAGFFAQGEIGPVGGRNFLHGYTASVAVFRART